MAGKDANMEKNRRIMLRNLHISEKNSTFAASFVYVYATYTNERTLKIVSDKLA